MPESPRPPQPIWCITSSLMVPDYCVHSVVEPFPLKIFGSSVSSHTRPAHLSASMAPRSRGLTLQTQFPVQRLLPSLPWPALLSLPSGPSSEATFPGKVCLSQLHWGPLSWPSHSTVHLTAVCLLTAGPFVSLKALAFLLAPQDRCPVDVQFSNSLPQTFKNISHHPSESGSNSSSLLDCSSPPGSHWSALLLGLLMDSLQCVPPQFTVCSLQLASNQIRA